MAPVAAVALITEDPAYVRMVRPFIISNELAQVTAIGASLLGTRVQVRRMPGARGVIVEADARLALACLKRDTESGEIGDCLAPDRPLPCELGAPRARLVARSQQ